MTYQQNHMSEAIEFVLFESNIELTKNYIPELRIWKHEIFINQSSSVCKAVMIFQTYDKK